MSERKSNNNDKKLPAKRRDSDSDDSTINHDSSATGVERPSVIILHDGSDGVEEGREASYEQQATAGAPGANPTSITSSAARVPETEEQSEPLSVETVAEPRAFPVPGTRRSHVNGDFTIPQQDTTPPPPDMLVTVHRVDMNEENQVRQEHESQVDVPVVAKAIYLSIDNEPQDIETDNGEQLDIMGVQHEVHERGASDEESADMIEAIYTRKRQKVFIVSGALVLVVIIVGIAVSLALKKDLPQPTPQPTRQSSAPEPTPEPIPGVWTQIGDDLVGQAYNDQFGRSIALSADGDILAVGAPGNDENGSWSGSVHVYQQNVVDGTPTWTRLGGDIYGVNANDRFGGSVSLSNDGTVLAVGASQVYADGNQPGFLQVFQFVNNDWTPIGDPINGRGSDDRFGSTVALSADGTVMAGGAVSGDSAAVYQVQNGNWNQLGSDVPGHANSVSLSHDGTVLAVGGGNDSNQVCVYHVVNDAWTPIGDPIIARGRYDNFGDSVSLSADGRIVAMGAHFNDDNGGSSGAAYIYENVNNNWIQVGSDLYGANVGDYFGDSVSLSGDGTYLAVGATQYLLMGHSVGYVRVFQLVNGEWTAIGNPINGRDGSAYFGYSVALSTDGTVVAAGAGPYGGDEYVLVHRLEEE